MKGQMKKIPCFWQQRGNGNADRSLQNGEIASGFAENPEIQKFKNVTGILAVKYPDAKYRKCQKGKGLCLAEMEVCEDWFTAAFAGTDPGGRIFHLVMDSDGGSDLSLSEDHAGF